VSDSQNEKNKFFGTYFDKDDVMRIARWTDNFSWVILVVYLISWILSLLTFTAQFSNGIVFDKGVTVLGLFNIYKPFLFEGVPGVMYFFSLQALSKGLLILLDIEENSRRASRK